MTDACRFLCGVPFRTAKNQKRKRLHVLCLELKQLRYQLEWVMDGTGQYEGVIKQLKQAQRCPGGPFFVLGSPLYRTVSGS